MKFLSAFVAALVICLVGNLLFGSILRNSFWLPAVVFAFIAAAAVHAHVKQDEKIEALERRIAALEDKEED